MNLSLYLDCFQRLRWNSYGFILAPTGVHGCDVTGWFPVFNAIFIGVGGFCVNGLVKLGEVT